MPERGVPQEEIKGISWREYRLIISGIKEREQKIAACDERATTNGEGVLSMSSAAEAAKKKGSLNGDKIAKPAHPKPN